jgi:HEAT repeat protein
VLGLLQDTEAVRPDLSDAHKQQVDGLFDGLARPERVKAIGTYLNRTPHAKAEGLLTLLLMMKKDAVPALCSLLASLEGPMHQSIVMEALETIGRDNVDPIVRGLTDKRPVYVRNLLTLLARWHDPRFAEAAEKTLRHPEAIVRRDALRLLATLRPSGNGVKLVALLSDGDETVRLTAMKILASGQFTAAFALWSPFITPDEFHERSSAEKRAIYLAMKQTAGDEAIPYWQGLLTEWSWTNRKKKEELALLAAETLGKLATPAAIAALEVGRKKGGTVVRQACTIALAVANRQQRQNSPSAVNS